MHPRETKLWAAQLDRRQFLRRSTGAALTLVGGPLLLSACQKREGDTTPSSTASTSPGSKATLPLYADNPAVQGGLSPEAGPLRLFGWNDYVYKKVLQRFQDQYSVEIDYTGYGSMAEGINKVENG